MAPALAGKGETVTAKEGDTVPLVQGLDGSTVMFPLTAEALRVTVMELVPEPELMLKPVGSVHV
jgi:hypothetical protein